MGTRVSGQKTAGWKPELDIFWRLDRLCFPRKSELRLRVITKLHEGSSAGQRGVASTLAKALDRFWWKRIRQDVKDLCERCVVCRRAKIQAQMAATLYPLPWHTVGLDCWTHLPESNGFNIVLIVVDHLTRMARFLPCTKTATAGETATLSLQGVYRLHGLPRVLISDRDPKFASGFLQTLWRRFRTRLNMSSSRHPETDGLTERVNNTFKQLLRCFSCYDGSDWTTLLTQVGFAYNASRAFGIEHTPFEANLGSLVRSPLTCFLACDGQFQFRKTHQSGYDCYRKYMPWYALCYSHTRTRCMHARNRLHHHTSSQETRCQLSQQTFSNEDSLTRN
jgi:hypothetical protein